MWFIPLPYFCWQLLSAVWNGVKCLGLVFLMVCLLVYIVLVTFIWCLAIAEVTIFTMIGGAVSPTMAFQYFILIGSVTGTVYGMIRNLHEGYDQILLIIVDILKEKAFQEAISLLHNGSIVIKNISDNGNRSMHVIEVKADGQDPCVIIRYDTIGTDVNTNMFFVIVERCRPIRRIVFFIIIKIIAMIFYSLIALWVKNVFHLEEKIGNIVTLICTVAVYFVPGFLQYIAYQNNYGKKMTAVLKQDIYTALLDYLGNDIFLKV